MEDTQKLPTTLVRLETTEGTAIKALLERLQRFRDCCLVFDADGVHMNATNTAHTVMTILRLDTLDNYYCRATQSIGIDVLTWFKLFKKITKDDVVVIRIDEEGISADMPYATIFIYNAARDVLVDYRVLFLDIDAEVFDIPCMVFDAVVSVPSAELFRVLRWCETGGSLVRVYTTQAGDKTKLVVKTAAQGQSESPAAVVTVQMNVTGRTKCETESAIVQPRFFYKLEQLLEVSRSGSMNPGGNAIIYLTKQDYPLVIDFDVSTMGTLKYCLAPVIDEAPEIADQDVVEPHMDIEDLPVASTQNADESDNESP